MLVKRLNFFIFVLFGLIVFKSAYSQQNFLHGYIIGSDGDTLRGFIDYRNWDKNPEVILFKQAGSVSTVHLYPTDILEFGVKDEIYVSGIVNSEVSPTRSDKLESNPELHLQTDTIFLQTLYKGRKSLYHYKNASGRDNFYIEGDNGFEWLVYKKYLKDAEGGQITAENKRYLSQLALYLNDCASINSKLRKTLYKKTDLIRLFDYYYKFFPSDFRFNQKIEKSKLEFGLLAGVSMTALNFTGSNFPYLTNASFDRSSDFSAGLFIDFVIPRTQSKWSVNNELFFTSYEVTGEYVESKSENFYSTTFSTVGYSYVKINTMVRFRYPLAKMVIFANAGISNGFALNETNYKKTVLVVSSEETVREGVAMDETKTYEQSFLFGVGGKLKKISAEIRYEGGNGMSAYNTLGSPTTRLYFLMGYTF